MFLIGFIRDVKFINHLSAGVSCLSIEKDCRDGVPKGTGATPYFIASGKSSCGQCAPRLWTGLLQVGVTWLRCYI